MLEAKTELDVLHMDFRKDFDSVSHSSLDQFYSVNGNPIKNLAA